MPVPHQQHPQLEVRRHADSRKNTKTKDIQSVFCFLGHQEHVFHRMGYCGVVRRDGKHQDAHVTLPYLWREAMGERIRCQRIRREDTRRLTMSDDNWLDGRAIPHDDYYDCEHCRRKTLHHCMSYPDEEIRRCLTCNTRTIWKPDKGSEHGLRETYRHRDDPSIDGYNRQRQEGTRQYRWTGWGAKRGRKPKRKK